MRALSVLRGDPITPAVSGSREEGCPWEYMRMLIWGTGSSRSVPGSSEGSPKAAIFVLGVILPLPGDTGNVWRHFLLSQLGKGCYWHLVR